MGQIFNRIKRIVGSYVSDIKYAEDIINSDNEELKKIIDELNNPAIPKGNNFYNNYKRKEEQQLPEELIKAYKIMNINPNSDIDSIKSAFKKAIKENHPDKFSNLNEKEKIKLHHKSQEIINAYNIIKKHKGF